MFRSSLLAVIASLSGCTAGDRPGNATEPSASAPVAADLGDAASGAAEALPLRIATYDPVGPSMLSRISIVLAEEDGCLVGKVGGDTILPIFRSGAVKVVAGRRISYEGREYGLGDTLIPGGGVAPTTGPRPHGLDLRGCPQGRTFLVG